ncbi:hypothetical protein QQX98_011892 [Neonectria punicea]|uniref:Uncharacterized protein n=1 Tax=Neonectria punicea TaxID=979145 RepID=A0ABR1GKL5_9HYPO
MKFSVDNDASLFGLDVPTDEHQSKLSAANAFGQLRRELDRNKTVLKTLTTRQYSKRRTNLFSDNLVKLVNGEKESLALLPLLRADPANLEVSIDQLILALFTLTKTAFENMEKNGFVDIFAALFSRVVGNCTIFPEMRAKFIDIINDVCYENSTENGRLLLHLLETRGTKRRRLDPSSSLPLQSHSVGAFEPLILSPEVLAPPETDHFDVPPDLIPKTVAIQFLEARGERLEDVLADSPMLQAMKAGRQWRWERQRDAVFSESSEIRTDSIIAMIPDVDTQDISFVLRVGYKAGWEILKHLDFRSSQERSGL